jgi:O-antigen ligase
MILWFRGIVECFPENLFGIGLGTPLLPYKQHVTTSDLGHSDEYISHVFGLHNTYITLFVRFGIPFIIFLIVIYRTIFKEFFNHRKYYISNRNDIALFLGFFTISTVGLFNLLLETPTLASIYWVSLGFVSKAIYYRQKKTLYELQNM